VVPNVLKWVWWRLNGWGYFAGMVTGILVSLLTILFWKSGHIVMSFPINMAASLAAAIIVSYATKKQDETDLQHFYTTTNPWGFWKPVKALALKINPAFLPNKNFAVDTFNVLIGIEWQMSMIIMPVYIVIKEYSSALMWLGIWAVCGIVLRFTWWKRLP
jgi:solute:Na+ symporter, SSS family